MSINSGTGVFTITGPGPVPVFVVALDEYGFVPVLGAKTETITEDGSATFLYIDYDISTLAPRLVKTITESEFTF